MLTVVKTSFLPPHLEKEKKAKVTCAKMVSFISPLLLLFVISASAVAHDLNPPDWAGSDNTVYARWEFSIAGYGNPDGLADDYNGPGPAYLMSNDPCGWTGSYSSHQGVLPPGEARFFLDNYTRDNARKKRIRVQATYYGTAPDIESETDDGETPVINIPPGTIGGPIQTYDLSGGWYHGTWEFDYDSTNPGAETITITGSYLDDVVIDTICYEGTDPNAGPGRKRTVGITEVFGGVISVERRCAMPYIMPEDGTVESTSMYHNSMGFGNVRFGIYTGQTLPDARIAEPWGTTIDYAEGWQTVNLIDPVFFEAGTKIWLAWLYENNPGIRYLDVDSSPGRAATFPKQTWSDPIMPDPFGSSVRDGRIHSIYATYTPSGGPPDVDPPTPNPAQWASAPGADGFYSISMTAATSTDATGVQYYFEETTGNPGAEDSGWQESPGYADYDLMPDTQYTYRVKTRDYSLLQNESVWSSPASATTDAYPTVGCPDGDLDGDCEVAMGDLLIFVEQWLDDPVCAEHPDDCADLNEDTDIDSEDFAVIAANWRDVGISRPLVINEFMASNDTTIADEHGEYDDWIEIYNMTYYPIDMSGMYIADTTDTWQVPAGITIGPHDYKIFWADSGWPAQGDTHTNFNLSRDSDKITLYDANSVTIDSISWTQRQETDESYGRYPDGTDNWYVMGRDNTTPGLPNDMGRAGAVYFSRPSSTFTAETFSLGLTTRSPTATIYYTNDGSEPTDGSLEYTGGLLTIGGAGRIRARAYEPNFAPGPVASETYMRIGVGINHFQTNLPIVLVDTFGFEIDEHEWDRNNHPMIATFIDTDPISGIAGITDTPAWTGYGGIHVRGASSAGYEKKQYKFETWDEYDQDKNVSLLGMPSESDWIIHGPYSDKTLMRNYLAYTWNGQMERYGVRCRFVEVFIDVNRGTLTQYDYRGVYVFMEDIKRDENRVDITRLLPSDNSEPQITGGYLLKKDWKHSGDIYFDTNYYNDRLIYVDPEGDEITTAQNDWLEDWFYEFELALASGYFNDPCHVNYYGNYIDILSFIDHHILVEISKNVDGYCLSTYLFKDRLDKLNMGPVWDYNGSLGGADYFDSWVIEGWHFNTRNPEDNPNAYEWYERLWQDSEFRLAYADRWWDLREDLFKNSNALADIDNNVTLLTTDVNGENAVDRNFTRWDVLYEYIWPNYFCCGSYAEHIDWMKYWIGARLDWLDTGVGNDCGSEPPTYNQDGGYVSSGFDVTISGSGGGGGSTQTFISPGATWSYLDNGSNQGTTWREGNVSSWDTGPAQLGYGDGDEATEVEGGPEGDRYATTYFRHTFYVADKSDVLDLTLRIVRDDGAVVYINGDEVVRTNMPGGTITYQTWASEPISEGGEDAWNEFSVSPSVLINGNNKIAVEIHQCGPDSSDISFDLELEAEVSSGSSSADIYYTTDGSDPRAHGGAITGTEYTGPIDLTATTQIKARIRYSVSDWSALNEATFSIGPVADNLRITEIMYHPPDPNHEFIELKNIGGASINLNLVKFTDGIDFTFPSMTLAGGNYAVVVRNQVKFTAKYPSVPAGKIAGEFTGAINNAGERIELQDALGQTIQSFGFKDGWYPITDGDDFSLNILDPTNPDPNSWEYSEYWQPSSIAGGTPADNDTGHVAAPGDIVINEVMTHTNSYPNDWIELYNTTGSNITITGWFLSDDPDNFKKYEIGVSAPVTILAHDYVVFTQDDDFGNASDPGSNVQFAFSELGETVYLCSGSGGELAGGFCAKEDFKASEDEVSFGRYTKSAATGYNVDFISMATASSGTANGSPRIGPVVITEIMYHPGSTDPCDITNAYAEYVEIKNISGSTIALNNWLLTDEDEAIEYYIPAGTSLASGEYLLLVKNEVAFNEEFTPAGGVTILEWLEGRLNNAGEKIQISRPGTPEPSGFVPYIRVDRVNYSDGSHGANFHELGYNDPWPTAPDGTGQALHRITDGNYGNDVSNWTAAAPSPGS